MGEANAANRARRPMLTRREERILELLGAGSSNQDMATVLYVSVKDIEYHVGNLLRKLEGRNRTEAVSRAYSLGYLSVGSWPPAMVPAGVDEDDTPRLAPARLSRED